MKSTVIKWILYSFFVGLIPVLLLGASPGGIALSPIILMLSLLIGLFGAAIHINIFAFTKGTQKQKIKSSVFGTLVFIIVIMIIYTENQCSLSEEIAKNKILKYIDDLEHLDAMYLGEYVFYEDSCQGSLKYDSPSRPSTIIIDKHHKIGEYYGG